MKTKAVFGTFLLLAIFTTTLISQEIPQKISFQGKLLENGVPVTGNKPISFTIGSWTEYHPSIEINDGLYSVVLGSVNPIPISVFNTNSSLELQIEVDGEILLPNTQIQAVGYAFKSEKAVDSESWAGNSFPGGTIWTSQNDGEGSGLDADLIDGLNSSDLITNPFSDVLIANSFYTEIGSIGFMAESSNLSNGFFAKNITDGKGFYADNCQTGLSLNDCHNGVKSNNGTGYGVQADNNLWDGARAYGNGENGFNATNNGQWGFYAQANNDGGFGGQSKGRCMNIISDSANQAVASFHNKSVTSRGIYVEGDVFSAGGYSQFLITDHHDEILTYPIISLSREIILTGTGVLENGHTSIKFENTYCLDNKSSIIVSITPLEDVNGFLVVNDKTKDSFNVKLNEIPGVDGNKNAKFDWVAILKIHNPYSVEETLKYIEGERNAKKQMKKVNEISDIHQNTNDLY